MGRSRSVFNDTAQLYEAAATSMGKWMWRNHTQWVADKSKQLAEKYGADAEKVYSAALLHDLGDVMYERSHADFDTWSSEKSKEILKDAGFRKAERDEILEVVRTHSYEECQDWFATKIERDFNSKICFEDEKNAVKGEYESLFKVFGRRTLDNNAD